MGSKNSKNRHQKYFGATTDTSSLCSPSGWSSPRSRSFDDKRPFVHGNVSSLLPHDLAEIERMDRLHYVLRNLMGSNHLAPIEQARRCLDCGTGSGIWVMEMASEYSSCNFVGIDIDTEYLPKDLMPSNCRFDKVNLLTGLPYSDFSFDYIHHRHLVTSIPAGEWPSYIQECARICERGGWLELVETDMVTHNAGPYALKLTDWFRRACMLRDIDILQVNRIPEFMNDAGLKEVKTRRFCLPLGSWGGRQGEETLVNMICLFAALIPLIVKAVGVTTEEVKELLEALPGEVNHYRSYWIHHTTIGRRA